MSIYGELNDEFRPRPAWWRIAVVSVAQWIIAMAIVDLLGATADGALLVHAKITKALLLHIGAPLPGFDAAYAVIAIVFLIIGEIAFDFLPAPRTLAIRHFVILFAEALAAFGAGRIAIAQPVAAAIVIGIAAILFVARCELAAIRLFNNVMDMKRPCRRFVVWLLRVGLWSAAASLPLRFRYEAIVLAAVTLLITLGRKPKDEYEETNEPRMHEAAAVLPLIAALIVGGLLWLAPRAVIVSARGVSVRAWKPVESDLAKRLRDRETRR